MTVRLFVLDSLRTHCPRPRTGGYHPSTCGRSDAAGPQGPGHDRRGPAARGHPGRAAGDPPVGSAVHRVCRAARQDPDAESTERRHLPRASTRRSARSRRATRASRSVAPRPGPPFSAKVLTGTEHHRLPPDHGGDDQVAATVAAWAGRPELPDQPPLGSFDAPDRICAPPGHDKRSLPATSSDSHRNQPDPLVRASSRMTSTGSGRS